MFDGNATFKEGNIAAQKCTLVRLPFYPLVGISRQPEMRNMLNAKSRYVNDEISSTFHSKRFESLGEIDESPFGAREEQ